MSLSVEAIKYLGHNIVVVRYWDGVDKPQKTSVFHITEEELDFKAGRFKLFTYDAWKCFSQKFTLSTEHNKLEDVINWISENVEGFWFFDISDNFSDYNINGWCVWIFYFKNAEDCVKFTLRWM